MKWYFTFNQFASQWFGDLVKVAVTSAFEHTNLKPHCLFDGGETELTAWLLSRGVPVTRRRVPFADRLHSDDVAKANAGTGYGPKSAEGFYLLLDVPFIEKSEEFVLYTDCDVVFRRGVDFSSFKPKLLAACPEFSMGSPTVPVPGAGFNSGVVVMNVPALRSRMHEVYACMERHSYYAFPFEGGRALYDQGALNATFTKEWDALPWEYNWRVVFGENPDARIVHWHGPKPHQVRDLLANGADKHATPGMKGLFESNPTAYRHYLDEFERILASVP